MPTVANLPLAGVARATHWKYGGSLWRALSFQFLLIYMHRLNRDIVLGLLMALCVGSAYAYGGIANAALEALVFLLIGSPVVTWALVMVVRGLRPRYIRRMIWVVVVISSMVSFGSWSNTGGGLLGGFVVFFITALIISPVTAVVALLIAILRGKDLRAEYEAGDESQQLTWHASEHRCGSTEVEPPRNPKAAGSGRPGASLDL